MFFFLIIKTSWKAVQDPSGKDNFNSGIIYFFLNDAPRIYSGSSELEVKTANLEIILLSLFFPLLALPLFIPSRL